MDREVPFFRVIWVFLIHRSFAPLRLPDRWIRRSRFSEGFRPSLSTGRFPPLPKFSIGGWDPDRHIPGRIHLHTLGLLASVLVLGLHADMPLRYGCAATRAPARDRWPQISSQTGLRPFVAKCLGSGTLLLAGIMGDPLHVGPHEVAKTFYGPLDTAEDTGQPEVIAEETRKATLRQRLWLRKRAAPKAATWRPKKRYRTAAKMWARDVDAQVLVCISVDRLRQGRGAYRHESKVRAPTVVFVHVWGGARLSWEATLLGGGRQSSRVALAVRPGVAASGALLWQTLHPQGQVDWTANLFARLAAVSGCLAMRVGGRCIPCVVGLGARVGSWARCSGARRSHHHSWAGKLVHVGAHLPSDMGRHAALGTATWRGAAPRMLAPCGRRLFVQPCGACLGVWLARGCRLCLKGNAASPWRAVIAYNLGVALVARSDVLCNRAHIFPLSKKGTSTETQPFCLC